MPQKGRKIFNLKTNWIPFPATSSMLKWVVTMETLRALSLLAAKMKSE